MARLQESKWFYILLSVLIAIVFWLYVRVAIDPVQTDTIHNVKVELTGVSVLTGQNLTVSDMSHRTIDLRVRAPSSVLNNLMRYRQNISVVVDVSRCTEGENRLAYSRTNWPANINIDDVVTLDQEPDSILVTVERLYSSTFNVEFQLNGRVADGYQMGSAAVEPSTVVVSGPVEQVSQVAKVAAVLNNENLNERFAGDLPLTLLDSAGQPLTGLDVTLDADSAYVVLPVVVIREVPLTINLTPGGGATIEDADTPEISPASIMVSGAEEDMENLTEISLGSLSLAQVVGTNTFSFPISLDPSLENISGETTATVTVTVRGLSTITVDVDNIFPSNVPRGYEAVAVTQVKPVNIRGREEDLANIDASQLRIEADLSQVTSTGQITVPARVYLNAAGSVGVIGEYTIVVNITR